MGLRRQEQAVGIEMDVNDVKSGVRSTGGEKDWSGEGVFDRRNSDQNEGFVSGGFLGFFVAA